MNTPLRPSFTIAAYQWVCLTRIEIDSWSDHLNIVADLWKAPKEGKVIGTATAGSSEAIMLGGLALKKRWQEARKAAGKDHYHPNIIFGSNAQVALEKFARWECIWVWVYVHLLLMSILPATSYFDVETRLVPVKASDGFIMNPHDAIPFVDENTIGIIVIMGSTYTGHFENVQLMNDLCTHTLVVTFYPWY